MLTIDHSPVSSSPQVLGGALVFRHTRVPVQTLLDYQNDGFTLERFLEFFPSVRRDDAEEFLRLVQAGAGVKIIFDENVPLPLRQFFPTHEVTTVQAEGWAGVENGAILDRVDGAFDVLVLADKNLRYQQNLGRRSIALVELPTNRWPALQGLAPKIVFAVEAAVPGSYTVIEI